MGAGPGGSPGGAALGQALARTSRRMPAHVNDDKLLIGFAAPVNVGDEMRDPKARCEANFKAGQERVECRQRWRNARGAVHDRLVLETWHRLLAMLAAIFDRKAVVRDR